MKIQELLVEAPVSTNNISSMGAGGVDPSKKIGRSSRSDLAQNALGGRAVGSTPVNQKPMGQQAGGGSSAALDMIGNNMKQLTTALGLNPGSKVPGADKAVVDKVDDKGVHYQDPQSGTQVTMGKDDLSKFLTKDLVSKVLSKDKASVVRDLNIINTALPGSATKMPVQKVATSLTKSNPNNVDLQNIAQATNTAFSPLLRDQPSTQVIKNKMMQVQKQPAR
jgi:hypothetical protein